MLCSQQVREGQRVTTIYANCRLSAEQTIFLPFIGTFDQDKSGILWKISKGLPGQLKKKKKHTKCKKV